MREDECLWRTGENFLHEVGNTPCERYKVSNGTFTWWIPEESSQYWTRGEMKERNCKYNNKIGLFQCNDTGRKSSFWNPRNIQILGEYKSTEKLLLEITRWLILDMWKESIPKTPL